MLRNIEETRRPGRANHKGRNIRRENPEAECISFQEGEDTLTKAAMSLGKV
jgi:hypothetical protein